MGYLPLLQTKCARAEKYLHRIFHLHEVENDVALQWFAGALFLGFFVAFNVLFPFHKPGLFQNGTHICWPFFPSCNTWDIFTYFPNSNARAIFFTCMFAAIVGGFQQIYARRWVGVHLCMFILSLGLFYYIAINFNATANYFYYPILLSLVYLFVPHKRFFSQLMVVMFYYLSTTIKLDDTWILATYFTSLNNGLPLTPQGMEIPLTNFVIFEEMIGCWFLFSSHKLLQRTTLFFFIFFHLYSVIFVHYAFPAIALPPLIALFGINYKPYKRVPLGGASLAGWLIIAALFAVQLTSRLISDDQKMTMEGTSYGLYMYEANHQCVITIRHNNSVVYTLASTVANARCTPYSAWLSARNRYCKIGQTYALTFDHAINGGPFYRIVDEPDMCTLTYHPFSHNSWIKTRATAQPVGRPHKNTDS